LALERIAEEFKVKLEVITKLEEKVDSLSKTLEKYQAQSKSSSIVSIDLLNNKVDKMVIQMNFNQKMSFGNNALFIRCLMD
jgi:hypothetical protein